MPVSSATAPSILCYLLQAILAVRSATMNYDRKLNDADIRICLYKMLTDVLTPI